MAFDGIVTKSVVYELHNIFGYKIDSVYQPNKNTIILGLYKSGINLSLLMCINCNYCRINLTKNPANNHISPSSFCMLLRKHLIGLKIKNIYTIDLERVVFIELENFENPNKPIYKKIVLELMGKHSNIILTDVNNIVIDSLRHTNIEEGALRDIYASAKYNFLQSNKNSFIELNDFDSFYELIEPKITEEIEKNIENIENTNINNFNIDKIISNTFNGISSSLINGIMQKLNIDVLSKENLEVIFYEIKKILNSNNLKIELFENKKDYYLWYNLLQNKFNLNFELDNFYFEKENHDLIKNSKNALLNFILAVQKKYKKRLLNIENKINESSKMEIYRLYGELITANLYKISNKNVNNICVENYYDNNTMLSIPLDPKYSPSINAKIYFKKYSKLKNALSVLHKQKEETIKEIDYIESIIYELEICTKFNEIEEVRQELAENTIFSYNKTKKSNNKKASLTNKKSSFNPIKYVIDGYTVLVGRNNKENDYLTCKMAHNKDIWFHTKEIHGSHVILRVENFNAITEDIIFKVAQIAKQHSKAKNSSHVPVDYCLVSNVKKPVGSQPGLVIYSHNKTVYV